MSRKNETVDGVFTKLHNSYFDVAKRRSPDASKETADLERMYENLLNQYKWMFDDISNIEQLILQRRVFDNPRDIKLGIQDGYIFAMCPFYRSDKKAHDIRVYPGKVSALGYDLESLHKDKEFMERVQYLLKQQMQKCIDKSKETTLNQPI
jgi:hypothetical protein